MLVKITSPLYILPELDSSRISEFALLVMLVVPLKILPPLVLSTPVPLLMMVAVLAKVLLPVPVSLVAPFFSRYAVPLKVAPLRNSLGALKFTSPPNVEPGPILREELDGARLSTIAALPNWVIPSM